MTVPPVPVTAVTCRFARMPFAVEAALSTDVPLVAVVTVANGASNAPWPYSAHNGGGGTTGFACDIGFFSAGGKYLDEGPQYDIAGKLARAAGFHWGADFGDRPHICLRPPSLRAMGETAFINQLIYRVNNGLAVWP